MDELTRIVLEARARGLSYGQFVATIHERKRKPKPAAPTVWEKRRKGQRRKQWSEVVAFQLWQMGRCDREIAKVLGVSRQIIQRWRTLLELPDLYSFPSIDPARYRFVRLPHGTTVLHDDKDGGYYSPSDGHRRGPRA